jgi:hypothetical protein
MPAQSPTPGSHSRRRYLYTQLTRNILPNLLYLLHHVRTLRYRIAGCIPEGSLDRGPRGVLDSRLFVLDGSNQVIVAPAENHILLPEFLDLALQGTDQVTQGRRKGSFEGGDLVMEVPVVAVVRVVGGLLRDVLVTVVIRDKCFDLVACELLRARRDELVRIQVVGDVRTATDFSVRRNRRVGDGLVVLSVEVGE